MRNNLGKISMIAITLLVFIFLVKVMQNDETIPSQMKEVPASKNEQIDLHIDQQAFQDYFNSILIDDLTYSESRIVELLEMAAMSVNPKGEVEIPSLDKMDDYFKGNMNEFSLLKQESVKGSPSILISQTPKSAFALDEAINLMDNELIKNELKAMSTALLDINYVDSNSIQEFINVYDRYASIQKKIIEVHYLFVETEKEFALKHSMDVLATFDEEFSKELDGESVKDMRISEVDDRTFKHVKIDDDDKVHQMLDLSAAMNLEKTDDLPTGDRKHVSIRTTNWRDILIEVYEHQIMIGNKLFEIKGENSLWDTIEQLDVEWETVY